MNTIQQLRRLIAKFSCILYSRFDIMQIRLKEYFEYFMGNIENVNQENFLKMTGNRPYYSA